MSEHTNTSEPLPEPWQSLVTGQIFRVIGGHRLHDMEWVMWETRCRKCGSCRYFSLPAEYSERIVTLTSLRWFGVCPKCRKVSAA